MKAIKGFFISLLFGIMNLPYLLKAQDGGTYIDNLGVQDSSYMEEDLLAGAGTDSGSGTMIVIFIAVVVAVAIPAYYFMKRKKKQG